MGQTLFHNTWLSFLSVSSSDRAAVNDIFQLSTLCPCPELLLTFIVCLSISLHAASPAPGACAGHCQHCWHGHQSSVPLSQGFWLTINLSSQLSPLSTVWTWQCCCRNGVFLLPGLRSSFPSLFMHKLGFLPPHRCCLQKELQFPVVLDGAVTPLDSCPPCWHPVTFEPHLLKNLMDFAPCCCNWVYFAGAVSALGL